MRAILRWFVFILLLTGAVACIAASQGMVADSRQITFATPTRVGETVLPAGEYEVRHSMEGANHIMVFRQVHTPRGTKPAEAKVKCTLVPLPEKALTTRIFLNDAGPEQKILVQMIFKGDTAKHVF